MNGLWFYQEEEGDAIQSLLQRVLNTFSASSSSSVANVQATVQAARSTQKRVTVQETTLCAPPPVPRVLQKGPAVTSSLPALQAGPSLVSTSVTLPIGSVGFTSTPATAGLTRGEVRDAFLRLCMTDVFIDLLHAELTKNKSVPAM